MGNYKNKTYPLRLPNELRIKIEIIAEKEDRPISKQYERIIKKYVESYEKEYGVITIHDYIESLKEDEEENSNSISKNITIDRNKGSIGDINM